MKKVAIIGATGVVGSTMIKVMEERGIECSIIPAASSKSIGKSIDYRGVKYSVVSIESAIDSKPDYALFAAGSAISEKWAQAFANIGCRVIDNSSFWRMDSNVKLIIPQVNGDILTDKDMIIANPNCSTIQMIIALAPLHRKFGLKRIVVSTYQSVTGSGNKGITQLSEERAGRNIDEAERAYNYPIDMNVIPQIDSFLEDGYTKEEMKMVNETHKLLNDYSIGVSATTVRVPVTGGHSESVNAEFKRPFELSEIRELLASEHGVVIQDNPKKLEYPMPLYVFGHDGVYVGRIRRDNSGSNCLNIWVVADNLRIGAATNAVDILMVQSHLRH